MVTFGFCNLRNLKLKLLITDFFQMQNLVNNKFSKLQLWLQAVLAE